MKERPWPTVVISALASASIWALSPWLSGHPEPWDSESLFYVVGLIVAGMLAGLLRPRPLWAHYVGAVAGQAAYELVFLAVGPLFVLGVAFLLGYAIVFVLAAAAGARLRERWQRRLTQGAGTSAREDEAMDRQDGRGNAASNGNGGAP